MWGGFNPSGAPTRILPDGCADIIWAPGLDPFVAGPDTWAKLESLPPGPYAGIRFRPGAAAALLGLPAPRILDLRVPLRELWPRAEAARLADRLAGEERVAGWLGALEEAVLARAEEAPAPDALVAAAVARIASQVRGAGRAGGAPPAELGERQLRRRFVAAVGYGPKRFERVLRLQRFVALAGGATRDGLAALALAAGYADQAHLTRECGELADVPPSALRPG